MNKAVRKITIRRAAEVEEQEASHKAEGCFPRCLRKKWVLISSVRTDLCEKAIQYLIEKKTVLRLKVILKWVTQCFFISIKLLI